MGTKALLQITSSKDGKKVWKKIIGMTSDGFPDNLEYLAQTFLNHVKVARKKTKLNDSEVVYQLMEEVCAKESDWWFIDDRSNGQWLSYSAVLNPWTKELKIENVHQETEITKVLLV